MIRQNLHMHTTWDDGACTAEEMIRASRDAGLTSVGVSLHSPLPEPCDWAPDASRIPAFLEEIHALRARFAGEITVYAGIEWDATSRVDLTPFDYVIGSVHHLSGMATVDDSARMTERMIRYGFGGDADAAAEAFFASYAAVAENPRVDIVGHFDVLTKFDEQRGFFKPDSPRYRRAARAAMEQLVAAGKIFEVNTGAISRGYRTTPYPSPALLRALRAMGGRVTVSADAHHTSSVTCAFDQAEALVRACGFEEVWVLEGKEFVPVRL